MKKYWYLKEWGDTEWIHSAFDNGTTYMNSDLHFIAEEIDYDFDLIKSLIKMVFECGELYTFLNMFKNIGLKSWVWANNNKPFLIAIDMGNDIGLLVDFMDDYSIYGCNVCHAQNIYKHVLNGKETPLKEFLLPGYMFTLGKWLK